MIYLLKNVKASESSWVPVQLGTMAMAKITVEEFIPANSMWHQTYMSSVVVTAGAANALLYIYIYIYPT